MWRAKCDPPLDSASDVMDVLVTLLILLFFLLVPLLPAIMALLMRRVVSHREQEPPRPSLPARPVRPPHPRAMASSHEHVGEVVTEEAPEEAPISLDMIPPRPTSLEEVVPRSEISLEEIPPSPPRLETRARRKPALLSRPIDVRRGVLLGALLGPPRADDPYGS